MDGKGNERSRPKPSGVMGAARGPQRSGGLEISVPRCMGAFPLHSEFSIALEQGPHSWV